MYLDIGSNATTINRTTITEKFTQTKCSIAYPNGVQFIIDDKKRTSASPFQAHTKAHFPSMMTIQNTALI